MAVCPFYIRYREKEAKKQESESKAKGAAFAKQMTTPEVPATDEEKAQQARHKLDGWKQAFRLDKRLLYKLDRPENDAGEAGSKPEPVEKPAPAAKSQAKTAANPKAKTAAKASKPAAEKSASATNGKVALLVRLYFSSHEKLSEQRWLERIPSEEPFKSASPKVVHHSDPEFESTDQKFEALE